MASTLTSTIAPVKRLRSHENHPASCLLEYLHDHRLVRSPEIPPVSAFRRNHRELADRAGRILLSSPGEPHRLWRIHGVSVENHPGSDYPLRVCRLRVVVS